MGQVRSMTAWEQVTSAFILTGQEARNGENTTVLKLACRRSCAGWRHDGAARRWKIQLAA